MLNNLFEKVYFDMQKFIFSNAIIITASGFAIGFVTNKVITSIMDISVMRLLIYLKSQILKQNQILSIPLEILWHIGVWIVSIITIFILLEYFLNQKIFGLASTLKKESTDDFLKSKVEAKVATIIPTSEDISIIKETNNKVKTLAKQNIDDKNIDIHELYKFNNI